MSTKKPLASNIFDASILLDGQRPLEPGTDQFDRLYVERPRVESSLLREVARACQQHRPFFWFFTGHTGSGKSTELSRIMTDQRITGHYLPIFIDLTAEFDLHNLEHSDLILAVGRACASKAVELGASAPAELPAAIQRWGAEVFREEETSSRSDGQAGLKLSIPFLVQLGEEVRSGGSRRQVIRQKIENTVLDFVRMIDAHVEALERHTSRRVLCILDGLDHAEVALSQRVLYDHFETLTLPKLSQIFVIPLALLNTPFLATIERQYSTVPNIKVFTGPGSDQLDPNGLTFYKELISRYVPLSFFTEEALERLFRLSAGIVRDMLRNTGDACGYAVDSGAKRVGREHAERVWNDVVRFYRSQLREADFAVLRKVRQQPHPEGIDGVPSLLHSKAIVFYPNGEGWYGVHPAVQGMIPEPEPGT